MLLELQNPIEVSTPLGKGYAIVFESQTQDSFWTVVLDNGAIVTFPQNKIRVTRSYTHHRGLYDEEMKDIIDQC